MEDEVTFDKNDFDMADEVIWNPWWGCAQVSTGCSQCMAYGILRRNKKEFELPIQTEKDKIRKEELDWIYPAGTVFRTCTLSDFFINRGDYMRKELWPMMKERSDCLFVINTRRPERIPECLPSDWGTGYKNVLINIAVESISTLDKRMNDFRRAMEYSLPHVGIALSPLLEHVNLEPYISDGKIEHVELYGEKYCGEQYRVRELRLDWVKDIGEQCERHSVPFQFMATGTRLTTLNGMTIRVWSRDQQPLAEFYNYSKLIWDDIVFQWKINRELLEGIRRANITGQLQKIMSKEKSL